MKTQTEPNAFTDQFWAMGCRIKMWLACDDAALATDLFQKAERLFHSYEQTFSRFLPDSELSQVNGRSGEWVQLSARFWEMLVTALAVAELTDGHYDPTLLAALEAAGYTHSFEAGVLAATDSVMQTAVTHPQQWQAVQLDSPRRAVWLPPGMKLDLNGIVKGVTAARAAQVLSEGGGCLINAGGDLVAGDPPPNWPGWPVAIAAPRAAALPQNLLQFWLANACLMTSGKDNRQWPWQGGQAHHLIDPQHGRPAENDLLTATVLLANPAQTEAIATAVCVMGCQKGADWLAARHIPALLATTSGSVHTTPAMRQAYLHNRQKEKLDDSTTRNKSA
ncbi:FAD:protein FMN transferase [Candidatus Leptofilum sp.]|uniref:FAD:protein FMN transferase n=1 Tax=Candidatus Leptofilum sp. TaxID=3241576 RepID=UPI003B58D25D